MTINDILQSNVNITNLSRDEYIRIIEEISYRYKNVLMELEMERNDKTLKDDNSIKTIKKLENDIESIKIINKNLMNIFDRDLTLSERIKGRIDIKKSTQRR